MSGELFGAHWGTPCRTWGPLWLWGKSSTRTHQRPQGCGTKKLENLANGQVRWMVRMIRLQLEQGMFVTVEHPLLSLMFRFRPFQALLREGLLKLIRLDQCAYGQGTPRGYRPREHWKKPTYFAVSHDAFAGLHRLCDGSHTHTKIMGSIRIDNRRVNRSMLAGRYPQALCRAYAECVHQYLLNGPCSPSA